jgi:RNA polymerase sigma-70 factor (ECF subfamily)
VSENYESKLDSQTAARLAAARQGDQHQFSHLAEPYRRELQVHCYRITGSLQDAEDLVQETMLRAWRRLETFQARASFRAWLYKIATNACLDALDRRRARRRLPQQAYPAADPGQAIAPPVAEPVWLEPYPDEWLDSAEAQTNPEARYTQRESVALAFVTALQALPPRQRAVLLLRDVLDWPAAEAAEILEMTLPAVNSALHRARNTMARTYHGRDRDKLAASPPDAQTLLLLENYVRAWENADVAELVALLKEEAILAMPPTPTWFSGRQAIGGILAVMAFAGDAGGRWRLLPLRANGQPAFAAYERDDPAGVRRPRGIHVLTAEGNRLAEVMVFLDPALPPRFGLPAELPAS